MEWAKILSFVYEKLPFYREVICFLINNIFAKVFQTSRVIVLTTLPLIICETPILKKYLNF